MGSELGQVIGHDAGNPRRGSRADRLSVVRLLRASHEAAGFAWPFRAAYAERLFLDHLADPDGCCIVLGDRPVGVLMARAFEHPFGAGKWAKETVWFVDAQHRGRGTLRMLDSYEAWARERGCTMIGMASLATHDVSAIYGRRGYAPAETHFVKAL